MNHFTGDTYSEPDHKNIADVAGALTERDVIDFFRIYIICVFGVIYSYNSSRNALFRLHSRMYIFKMT